jgi:hypothetical protein
MGDISIFSVFSNIWSSVRLKIPPQFQASWRQRLYTLGMYLPIDYNCFDNQLYHKTKIICKKRATCKKNKATLILLCSRGRATSDYIGREFRPLRLVWWALQGAHLWKGKRKRSHFFNWPYPMYTIFVSKKLGIEGEFWGMGDISIFSVFSNIWSSVRLKIPPQFQASWRQRLYTLGMAS